MVQSLVVDRLYMSCKKIAYYNGNLLEDLFQKMTELNLWLIMITLVKLESLNRNELDQNQIPVHVRKDTDQS